MKEKYLKCLIVIVVIIIGGLFIYQNINKENKPLPEVKLKEIVNKNKSFAIMIQNENGYKEYNSDTWPGNGYKFKEFKCIDNNGDEIKEAVTYEEGKITLTTNKTVYCTVYFDYKGTINILRENDSNKNLSSDIQGDMYRYQGTDDVPNWICFGTSNLSECTNETNSDGDSIPDGIDKYMYRIIGVTEEGQLYLLKETFLKEGETNKFKWNTKNLISDCLGETCEWPNTDMYKRLNGEASNGNPIFINNGEYEYMSQDTEWYNLIGDHNWMYGDTNNTSSLVAFNGNEMYAIETGKTKTKRIWPDEETQTTCSSDNPCTEKEYTWSKSTNAKIGLMYMHDIDYAYTGGNPGNDTNIKNSWVHFQKDEYNTSPNLEWLTTRFASFGAASWAYVAARRVNDDGALNASTLTLELGARPVFYLESSVKIASGSGTKSNPYILDVQE